MSEREDDDPQLRALRAVWLAMPDEDPPSRGLDALMAAARVKAGEMTAVAPWWRRVLDVLRRPPVLALASVVVLIGGAVLISQREDVKQGPALRQREDRAPEQQKQIAPAAPAVAPTLETKPEPPPEVVNPHAGADTIEPPRPVVPHHHESPKPPVARPPSGITAPAFTPATKTAPKLDEAKRPQAGEDAFGATDAAVTDDKEATTRGPRQTMVDQLLVQSRTAANRGDCENARLIAARIQKQDGTFYRERVATDTAIQKCITQATTTLSE
jgi:hypothetical protein